VNRYSLSHLSDSLLLRALTALIAQDRSTTATLLAHLAEVDARKLYLPAAYPSMFAYCVGELRFSEDAACKRIRAARAGRQFPTIFTAVAEGQLHLAGVVLLAPHLTEANAKELLSAASGKTKAEIEELLAQRFPGTELLPLVHQLPTVPAQPAPAQDETSGPTELAPERVPSGGLSAPGRMDSPAKLAPIATERYALQLTIGRSTQEKLRYAQALLSHAVPSGEIAEVLDRALDALIHQLEQRKFAGTDRPRPCRPSGDSRHIPAEVKRAVWERDGGRCSFVGESGHRCESRAALEFDHVEPVASAGRATAGNLRLRCRAHNQYEAERHFGRDFMRTKRETGGKPPLPEHAAEVIPWLRQLGMRAGEARRWAECCTDMAEASLEERLRHALRCSARSSPRRAA
jgi:hypothetical protein